MTLLRWTGLVEGVSTLLLFFVAMPLKYMADMPMAVTLVGSIHGLLFMAYVGLAAVAWWNKLISGRLAIVCVLAAIVPTGPFFVDPKLKRVSVGDTAAERATGGGAGHSPGM